MKTPMFFLGAFTLLSVSLARADLSTDLVAYYPFNGNAHDESGHANDGTANGAVLAADRFGTTNSAYSFLGTPSSKITIASTNLLLQPPFSFSLWVNWTGGTDNPRFLSVDAWEISLNWPGTTRPLNFNTTTASGLYTCQSVGTFTQGVWHQVVGVRSTNAMTLYIDGQLQSSAAVTDLLAYRSGFGTVRLPTIGGPCDIGYPYDLFSGSIDDVRIYSCALSYEEVTNLYVLESTPLTTNNCVVAPSGLVSWWKAEGNGLDSADGNHGTLLNGADFASGAVGQAFAFSTTNAAIRVPASASLDVGTGSGLTVDCWINPTEVSQRHPIVEWNTGAGSWGAHFYIDPVSFGAGPGALYANVVDSYGSWHQIYSASGAVTSNVFQHVAFSYDKTTGLAKLYCNGAVVAQQNLGSFAPSTSYDLYLGHRPPTGGETYTFAGLMDEVSLYRRALSDAEIQAIYVAGSAGKCLPAQPTNCTPAPSGLVGWWPAESNANDSVSGNNGVGQNIAYAAGEVGLAFVFNGSSASIRVPANSSLDVGLGGGLTMEVWINPLDFSFQEIGEWNHNGSYDPHFSGGQIGAHLELNEYRADGSLWGNLIDTSGNAHAFNTAGGVIATNTWQHVAMTYDKASGVAVLYCNGVAVATANLGTFTPQTSSDFFMGCRPAGPFAGLYFNGKMDEVSVYNRALSAAEIQSVYTAGSAGKCAPPPTNNCVPAPSGVVDWWNAAGNANDVAGGNNGTLLNGAGFGAGMIGEAFAFDGTNQCVEIPYSASLIPANFSVEAWINPSTQVNDPIGQELIFGQEYGHCQMIVRTGTAGVRVAFQFGTSHYSFYDVVSASEIPIGQFSHLVGTWDGVTLRLYINGAQSAQRTPGVLPVDAGCPFYIGGFYNPAAGDCQYVGQFFHGLIDEVTYYSRALSDGEIQAIYSAGNGGKCPLPPPPVITSQPANQTVSAGTTATFVVGAQGVPMLNYQWFFGVNPIAGQTNSDLVLTNVLPSQAGFYSVVVSNAYGSVTSSNALLTVLTYPPTITSQPGNVAIYAGSNATFTVVATGTAPLSYQWFFNSSPLTGRTSPTLALTNVQPAEAGTYSVTITNLYGTAVSSNALLTVLPPPVCVPPPSGLVAWWRFESNTVDSVGVNDLYGPKTEPVPSLPYRPFITGKVGAGYSFQYYHAYTLPSDDLNLGSGAGFTIEGWIRPSASVSAQPLIEWNDGLGHFGAGLIVNPSARARVIGAVFTDASAPNRQILMNSTNPVLTNMVWQHVALTFDHASGLATIYVNGSTVAQMNLGTFTPMTQAPIYLGCRYGQFPNYYSGSMDEMSLYSRALTAAEIQSVYQADFAGKCPPPPPACAPAPSGIVGWWRGQSNTLDAVNGNSGLPAVGASVSYTNGEVGAAFQFGPYVRVPASSNLNVGAGAGLTLELWIYPLVGPYFSAPSMLPVVGWNNNGTQAVYVAYGSRTPSSYMASLEANLRDTEGKSHIIAAPTGLIRAFNWMHLTVTYDKATGLAAMYCNGVRAAQTNLGTFTPATGGDLFLAPPTGTTAGWRGLLDEVSVYNRALDPAEIRAIVASRGAGKCAEAPVILTEPQSQVINLGQTAVFTVTAAGTPNLHYQWFFNSNAITGATDPTLVLTNVQTEQVGNYLVVVSNQLGVASSSNAVLRVNLPPVADAGATPPVVISCNDSNARVVLDGSHSSDPDGDSLHYSWFEDGTTNTLATGVVAVVTLPVGTNLITLQVSDGLATSDQTIAVEVITTAQAVERLMAQVTANVGRDHPLMATLSAALDSIARGDCIAAINQLEAFQNQVRAQVAPGDSALAETLIEAAQRIVDAIEDCCDGHGRGHERIHARMRHAGGKVHMEFPATRGRCYLIEASNDLVHWEKIGVANDRKDDTFEFEDAKAGQTPMRFYRIVAP